MPQRNAETNHANWKQLIEGLEPFAPESSFTTNEVQATLGGDITVQFIRDALNVCAAKGWVEKTGRGKHRRWNILAYDALSGLCNDDIEALDRQRAAARTDQTNKRRSQLREQQRKANTPPAWKGSLQGHLRALTAEDFEKLAALIVVAEGHTNVIHTRFNGDGGKDIIADYPVSSMISARVLIECKHTTKRPKGNVGKGDYDELLGVITRSPSAAHGVLMTNGAFTRTTKQLAAENPAITLQGPDEICDLLKDHELLVATRTHTDLALDADYFGLTEAPRPPGDQPTTNEPGDPPALSRALVAALDGLDAERFTKVATDVLAAESCDTNHIPRPDDGIGQSASVSSGPPFAPQRFCVRIDPAAGELTRRGIDELRAHFARHTGEADSGLLITRQRCDTAAGDAATRRWPIHILDVDDLTRLLIKHRIGITTATRETVAVPDEFADFHAELQRLYNTAHNDGTIRIEGHQPPRNGHNTN